MLTLVGVPSNACRVRGWLVRVVAALPLMRNNGTLFPRQTILPLGALLAAESLPFPLLYLHSQHQSSPWIHSLNPTLNHSAPASIGRLPSQAGVSRADCQGGFGMGSTQDPRAYMGRGGLGLRGG